MRLLGLDLASHVSGACCGDGTVPPIAEAWRFPDVQLPEDRSDYGLLLDALCLFLDSALRRWPDIEAVAYEAPLLITGGGWRKGGTYGDKLSTLRLLYPMSAFVEFWCKRHGLPCYEIGVQDAKKEATGKANATKQQVAAIAECCGVVLPKFGRLDAADSWSIWLRLLRPHSPELSERWQKAIHGKRRFI